MKFNRSLALWLALCAAWAWVAEAGLGSTNVVLTASADTCLLEAAPDNNLGANPTLVVGATLQGARGRALIRFDLSGIPTNAIILNAYLNITSGKLAASSAGTSISAYRMFQPWIEGTQGGNNGAPAAPGEPSWNSRLAPNIPWAQPGGKSGIDCAPTPSATQVLVSAGTLTFNSTTNMVFDVQTWVTNPSSNQGWILISGAEEVHQSAVRINAREAGQSPPGLNVIYSMPSPAFWIEAAEKSSIYFLVHLNLEAGNAYTLQYRENVDSGPWLVATNFPPDSAFRHFIWAEGYTNLTRRFFRLGLSAPGL